MAKTNFEDQVKQHTKDVDFDTTTYNILFDTTLGPITLELYPKEAPIHCKNIIGLVKSGFYDDISFHRIIPNFVIQAGCPQGSGTGGPGYTIQAEFNNIPHKAGVLSMARTQDPNSAGSQFFLCLGEVSYLDGQYTVFGQALDKGSLEVIQKIGALPTDSNDKPLNKVLIKKASVLEKSL